MSDETKFPASPHPVTTQRSQVRPSLPFLSSPLGAWSRPMDFVIVGRKVVDFEVAECRITVQTKGIRYPMKAQAIDAKPVGERTWKWETMLCLPEPALQIGDELVFGQNQQRYRVMYLRDWSEYGYMEYDICQGYET
jgi:hypothetical protein